MRPPVFKFWEDVIFYLFRNIFRDSLHRYKTVRRYCGKCNSVLVSRQIKWIERCFYEKI